MNIEQYIDSFREYDENFLNINFILLSGFLTKSKIRIFNSSCRYVALSCLEICQVFWHPVSISKYRDSVHPSNFSKCMERKLRLTCQNLILLYSVKPLSLIFHPLLLSWKVQIALISRKKCALNCCENFFFS